jgi:hypothetical protein
VQALGKALDDPNLSELRFRSNVSVNGLEPFEEQGWIGKTVRVGSMQFRVHTSNAEEPRPQCVKFHSLAELYAKEGGFTDEFTKWLGPCLKEGLGILQVARGLSARN